jgi:Zinc-binding dehydrogenase
MGFRGVAAGVTPGDTVAVFGVGGIGINAVQGARYAGAKNVVAIDPLENKREKAMELGATHAFATAEEAQGAIIDMTRGQGADSAILTVDLMTAEVIGAGFNAVGKGGVVVVTGLNKLLEPNIQLPATVLTLFRKTLKGTLFGDCNPTYDIPKLLGLYQAGDLKLDEIITKTYTLDQVNEGYDDLLAEAVDLARATREHPDLRSGASVRGAIDYARLVPELADARAVPVGDWQAGLDAALTTMSGRVRLHEACRRSADQVIEEILRQVRAADDAPEGGTSPGE